MVATGTTGTPVNQNVLTLTKISNIILPIQGILVPILTLGPFLTLSVRNEHTLKDWSFRIPAHIESKSR